MKYLSKKAICAMFSISRSTAERRISALQNYMKQDATRYPGDTFMTGPRFLRVREDVFLDYMLNMETLEKFPECVPPFVPKEDTD